MTEQTGYCGGRGYRSIDSKPQATSMMKETSQTGAATIHHDQSIRPRSLAPGRASTTRQTRNSTALDTPGYDIVSHNAMPFNKTL